MAAELGDDPLWVASKLQPVRVNVAAARNSTAIEIEEEAEKQRRERSISLTY